MDAHSADGSEDGFVDPEPWLADPEVFTEIDRWCASLRTLGPSQSAKDSQLRIHTLERLASTIAAVQSREAVSLHNFRRREDLANGLPKKQRGVYAGDEIALAKRVSPATGRKFLSRSRTLCQDLPKTYAALSEGAIPESRAQIVAEGTAKLSRRERKIVDKELEGRLTWTGNRRVAREVRGLVQEITADTAADRAAAAAEQRHVSLRCLDDGMARINAVLPMVQAVAVFDGLREAALSRAATASRGADDAGEGGDGGAPSAAGDLAGIRRTERQLMADVLVEQLTGQSRAGDVPTQVHIVMEAESLFADGRVPAWLPEHGPLPARTAREFLTANEADTYLRRVFTAPESGKLVSMDQRRRNFRGLLRRMLIFRDDVCRTPWCDAPIKHADHVRPAAEGGQTEWSNASGLCASCNFAKEHAGWRHEATAEGLTVITPTGTYTAEDAPLVTKLRRSADGSAVGQNPVTHSTEENSAVEKLFAERILRDTG
ncbi:MULTISPECIES: DUF222 domain-containing protein [unclassified Brevibacterium]|uniref:HNH endonuclease n=2 Tax=Brevibacterium TaxID=1696 RepID=UPI001E4C69BB|nr:MULTISPECIES: DUF222 domain-containing protein [unclassified Brevibacterium]MCD1287046.1 HNH endonuclease [Brevibacterium sp. CCUG 69071]MDK8436275.1 DUF222 domain-containing protein [Brevibacterium sp. H-BE7]